MNDVNTLNINGVTLEYMRRGEEIYILNTKNRRYILADSETLQFLKDYDHSEKNIDIEEYLYKKKINILDFKILNLKIKSSILNKIINLLDILFNKFIFIISLFSIVFIPKILLAIQELNFTEIKGKSIFIVYVIQFFIICLHELGHYQEYVKICKREYSYFGIQIRYFCLFLFYTDVSFFNILNKSQKLKIILAGIRNQFILNFVFIILYLITVNKTILYIICINWVVIITNCLPFMKLDGFWIINILLNTQNYMDDFIVSIKNKTKTNPSVIILGILNITIITIAFLGMLFNVINKVI